MPNVDEDILSSVDFVNDLFFVFSIIIVPFALSFSSSLAFSNEEARGVFFSVERLVSFNYLLFKVDFFFFSSIGDSSCLVASFVIIVFGMHPVPFLLSFLSHVTTTGQLSPQV